MRNYGTSLQEQVWDALTSCSSLRRLEIRPEYVEHRIKELLHLRENGVKDISMVQCVNLQEVRRPGTRQDIFDDVWIGVSQPVEFPSRIESVPLEEYVRTLPHQQIRAFRGLANRFQHTVTPQCRQATRLKLEAIYYKTPSNLNASLDPLEISINIEGRIETWKVRVWGLPSTKEERARLAKREWLKDEQRQANGLPTRREEGLNRAREEALEAKRSVIEARECQAKEIRIKKREDKNAEKEQLCKIKAKKKVKNEKTKLNRKVRKSEQDRLRERKRVSGA